MRKKIIVGNWKMNKTVSDTIRMITELKGLVSGKQETEIVVAPSFVSLHPAEIAAQGTPIKIGAQNVYVEDSGAYTGEVSAPMLAEAGCAYVIVGHSERRQIFGETDAMINKKVRAVLDQEMSPILCVGETKTERTQGKTFDVVETQLRGGLRGVSDSEILQVVLAYEPVWAIGTGDTATPSVAQEVHLYLREKMSTLFRKDIAKQVRLIYGGSLTPSNAKEILAQPDIDGALVGGASLDAWKFVEIIQAGE